MTAREESSSPELTGLEEKVLIRDAEFCKGEVLSGYKFHVLLGFVRDATSDRKSLDLLKKARDEMRDEIANKNALLQENDAVIKDLRQREAADIAKFKQETAGQLRSQCDKIVSLNKTVQELLARNSSLEAEQMELQCRERELNITNERLSIELERVNKELDAYRSSFGTLRLEMNGMDASISERQTFYTSLQNKIELLAKDLEEKTRLLENKESEFQACADQLKSLNTVLHEGLKGKQQSVLGLFDQLNEGEPCTPQTIERQIPSLEQRESASMEAELVRFESLISCVNELHGLPQSVARVLKAKNKTIADLFFKEEQLTCQLEKIRFENRDLQQENEQLSSQLTQSKEETECVQRELEAVSQAQKQHGEQLVELVSNLENDVNKKDVLLHGIIQQFSTEQGHSFPFMLPSPLKSQQASEDPLDFDRLLSRLRNASRYIIPHESCFSAIKALFKLRDDRVASLTSDLERCRRSLADANSVCSSRQQEIEALKDELSASKSHVAKQADSIAQLSGSEQGLKKALDAKEEAMQELMGKVFELTVKCKDMDATNGELRKTKADVSSELAQVKETLRCELERSRARDAELQAQLDNCCRLRQKLEHYVSKKKDISSSFVKEMEGRMVDKETTWPKVSAVVSVDPAADGQIEKLHQELLSLEKFSDKVYDGRLLFENVRKSVARRDMRIEELSNTETRLTQEVAKHTTSLRSAGEKAQNLTSNVQELSTKLKSVGSERDQLVVDVRELKANNSALCADLEATKKALEQEKSEKSNLEKLVAKRLHGLQDATTTLEGVLERHEHGLVNIVSEHVGEDGDLYEPVAPLDRRDNPTPSDVVFNGIGFRDETRKVEFCTRRIEALSTVINSCRKLLASRDATINEGRETISRLKAAEAKLTDELQQQTASVHSLNDQKASLLFKQSALQETVTVNEARVAQLQTAIADLQGQREALLSQVAAVNAEKGHLEREKNAAREDYAAIAQKITETTVSHAEKVQKLQDSITELYQKNDRLAYDRDHLEAAVKKMEIEIRNGITERGQLKTQLSNTTAELEKSKASFVTLQKECQFLDTHCNRLYTELKGCVGKTEAACETLVGEMSSSRKAQASQILCSPSRPSADIATAISDETLRNIASRFVAIEGLNSRINTLAEHYELIRATFKEHLAAAGALQKNHGDFVSSSRRLVRLADTEQRLAQTTEEARVKTERLEADNRGLRTEMAERVRRLGHLGQTLERAFALRQGTLCAILEGHNVEGSEMRSSLKSPWNDEVQVVSVRADSIEDAFDSELSRILNLATRAEELQHGDDAVVALLSKRENTIEEQKKLHRDATDKNQILEADLRRLQIGLKEASQENESLKEKVSYLDEIVEQKKRMDVELRRRIDKLGVLNQAMEAALKRRDEAVEYVVKEEIIQSRTVDLTSPKRTLERLDVALDVQLSHLESTVSRAENNCWLTQLKAFVTGKDIRITELQNEQARKDAAAADSVQRLTNEIATISAANKTLKLQMQDLEERLSKSTANYSDFDKDVRAKVRWLFNATRDMEATVERRNACFGSMLEEFSFGASGGADGFRVSVSRSGTVTTTTTTSSNEDDDGSVCSTSNALARLSRTSVATPRALTVFPDGTIDEGDTSLLNINALVAVLDGLTARIEGFGHFEISLKSLLMNRDFTIAEMRKKEKDLLEQFNSSMKESADLRDVVNRKIEEIVLLSAKNSSLSSTIEVLNSDIAQRETDNAQKIKRLWRLNKDVEDGLIIREEVAMNMVKRFCSDEVLAPIAPRISETAPTTLDEELNRLTTIIARIDGMAAYENKLGRMLHANETTIAKLEALIADLRAQLSDEQRKAGEMKAAYRVSSRWKEMVNAQAHSRKDADTQRRWHQEEEYARARLNLLEFEEIQFINNEARISKSRALFWETRRKQQKQRETEMLQRIKAQQDELRQRIVSEQEEEYRGLLREIHFAIAMLLQQQQRKQEEEDALRRQIERQKLEDLCLAKRRSIEKQELMARRGLAIEIDFALKAAIEREIENSKRIAAYIGIEITEGIMVDTEGTGHLDTLVSVEGYEYNGVKIVSVKGPALRDGLIENDIITHLDDTPTSSLSSFKIAASKVKPGDSVDFSISRNGERRIIRVNTSKIDRSVFTPGNRRSHRVTLHNVNLVALNCDVFSDVSDGAGGIAGARNSPPLIDDLSTGGGPGSPPARPSTLGARGISGTVAAMDFQASYTPSTKPTKR